MPAREALLPAPDSLSVWRSRRAQPPYMALWFCRVPRKYRNADLPLAPRRCSIELAYQAADASLRIPAGQPGSAAVVHPIRQAGRGNHGNGKAPAAEGSAQNTIQLQHSRQTEQMESLGYDSALSRSEQAPAGHGWHVVNILSQLQEGSR